jgi:hypothetical protein
MWFTPGIMLGGLIVAITHSITGRADQWWLWLSAVIIAGVIDTKLGFKKTRRPKVPQETVYKKSTK